MVTTAITWKKEEKKKENLKPEQVFSNTIVYPAKQIRCVFILLQSLTTT